MQAAANGCKLCSFIVAKFNEQRSETAYLNGQDMYRDLELSLDLQKCINQLSIHHPVVDLEVQFQNKSKGFRTTNQKALSTQERHDDDSWSEVQGYEETIDDKDNRENDRKLFCSFGISVPFRT